jgi:glutamine amidotransferase
MQWNVLSCADHPLLAGLDGAWVYFVHSLAPVTGENVIATADYGGTVVAAAARDNVMATQFHPEKSAEAGLRLLSNFVELCR